MKKCVAEYREFYFPALICAEYDSPIDALVGLHVSRNEAMNLVAAIWMGKYEKCIVTRLDGGRYVAAILLTSGHWAACNAFAGQLCATPREAERRLEKLLKRGQQGTVGTILAEYMAPCS